MFNWHARVTLPTMDGGCSEKEVAQSLSATQLPSLQNAPANGQLICRAPAPNSFMSCSFNGPRATLFFDVAPPPRLFALPPFLPPI